MPSFSGITRATELPNRALNVYDVAEYLGCCTATVYREVKRGRLRASRVGTGLRFRVADVEAYLSGVGR